MGKAKLIILLFILIAAILGYSIGKYSNYTTPTKGTQLNLPFEQVKVSGVDGAQQKQIEDFINKFYEYQQQKDIEKLLALFTPPANKQEQNDLDFLLGGYYIRDITRHNDTVTVLVDEMRVIYSGGEYVGYSANIANLVLEIKQSKNELKIVKYYHAQANDISALEGFIAY